MYKNSLFLIIFFSCSAYSMGLGGFSAIKNNSSSGAAVELPNEWIKIDPQFYRIACTCPPSIPVRKSDLQCMLTKLDNYTNGGFWGFLSWLLPPLDSVFPKLDQIEKLLETYEHIRLSSSGGSLINRVLQDNNEDKKKTTYLHRLPPELLVQINSSILIAKKFRLENLCKINSDQAIQTIYDCDHKAYPIWLSPAHICILAHRVPGIWTNQNTIRQYGGYMKMKSPILKYIKALEQLNTMYQYGALANANAKGALGKLAYVNTERESELWDSAYGNSQQKQGYTRV